jgi:hypothetical protein
LFFVYFLDRISHFLPKLASSCDLPTSISQVAGIRGMHHLAWIILWDRVLHFSQAAL